MLASTRSRPVSPCRDLVPPPLTAGARVEVCITGCGLAGLIAGYLLAREKRAVMVLDEGPVSGSASGAEIARGLGLAIHAIEAIVRRERIACDFERLDGYCLPDPDAAGAHVEQAIAEAARTGMSVERVEAPPIAQARAMPCVRWPSQALLHPGKLAAGLARAIAHEGGRIHCGIQARGIEAGRMTSVLTSAGHRIEADVVVRPDDGAPATAASVHTIGLRVPRGAITRALYWDPTGRRCAWLRAQGMRGADVLVVAHTCEGSGTDRSHDALESWARMHFRCAGETLLRASAQAPRRLERFRLVGRDACEDDAVRAGDEAWGTPVTRAAVAGMVIKDLVEGGRAPWAAACMPPPARALA